MPGRQPNSSTNNPAVRNNSAPSLQQAGTNTCARRAMSHVFVAAALRKMKDRQNDMSDNLYLLLKRLIIVEDQEADNRVTLHHADKTSIDAMRAIAKILKDIIELKREMNEMWKKICLKKKAR